MRKLSIIFFLFSIAFLSAQSDKKGWTEQNKSSKNGFYFGLSGMYYHYGLAPLDIYASDISFLPGVEKNFKHRNLAPGFNLGVFFKGKKLCTRIEYSRNVVRTSAAYTDAANEHINDRIKIANSQLNYIFYGSFKKAPALSIGTSMDLGIFRTKQKRNGAGYSGKWEAFYQAPKIFGSGIKTYTPTAGLGLYLAYRIKNATISLNRQFLIMDADMKGDNGSSCYFNTHNYKLTLYYALF